MKLRAKHWKASLRQMMSVRTELMMSLKKSSFYDTTATARVKYGCIAPSMSNFAFTYSYQ